METSFYNREYKTQKQQQLLKELELIIFSVMFELSCSSNKQFIVVRFCVCIMISESSHN